MDPPQQPTMEQVVTELQRQVHQLTQALDDARNEATAARTIATNVQGVVNAAAAAVPAAGAGNRRPNQRIQPFTNEDGDNDWLVFKRHFINCADLNNYDDREKRLALAGAMTGKAALATMDINVDAAGATFHDVLTAFESRFLPAAASQLSRVKFDGARQGPSETILNYHSRMRSLFNRAYPDAGDDVILIRRFIMGLRRRELRMQEMRDYPATYARALEIAQNEASVIQMVKVTELGAAASAEEPMEIGALDEIRKDMAPKKGPCHFCGKPGHWKKDCLLLKKSKALQNPGNGRKGNAADNRRKRTPRQNLIAALADLVEAEDEETTEEPEAEDEAADPSDHDHDEQDF